ASSAFSAVNAFVGLSENPFALFLGPPAVPAKIAGSQGGGLDQEAGRNSSGGGSAGSGGATATGGSPSMDRPPPTVAEATAALLSAASSAALPLAPAAGVGSVPANGPADAPAGPAQGLDRMKKHLRDPLYVVDVNKGIVVTPGVTEHEFSNWS